MSEEAFGEHIHEAVEAFRPLFREKEPHPEKVEVLGPMELRVKVAELCGWKKVDVYEWEQFGSMAEVRKPKQWADFDVLPNWPNDLNACADFERDVLRKNVRLYLAYARKLIEWRGGMDAVFASAKTRCEAFVEIMEAPSVPSGTEKHLADSSNPNS